MRRLVCLSLLLAAAGASAPDLKLPSKPGAVRFAVIGDCGTGRAGQYEVAQRLAACRREFPFGFVLMLGDNIYGHESPADFESKFEKPYGTLLDAGVKFYASLGNHDRPTQRYFKPFNMEGKRYYSFRRGNAEFFALDSNYMDPRQLAWLEEQLAKSDSAWKICFFHHPLYSHGRKHRPAVDLRRLIEPLFEEYGVSVVFSGHEHAYERIVPQHGINYFVLGSSGQLRFHTLRRSEEIARGFDTEQAFMLVEISGEQLYFQTISRTGETVDAGVFEARGNPVAGSADAAAAANANAAAR